MIVAQASRAMAVGEGSGTGGLGHCDQIIDFIEVLAMSFNSPHAMRASSVISLSSLVTAGYRAGAMICSIRNLNARLDWPKWQRLLSFV
jgi:hypothetical protein